MDPVQTGALLALLRAERGMTQRQVAERLHVSAQAVSKWETGAGCPDVEFLPSLAGLYGVSVERLLHGELDPNDRENGNMKRLQFYVCPVCGNLLTATGRAELQCCGRRLNALEVKQGDEAHGVRVEEVEDEWYVTFPHPMEKGHFVRFLAAVGTERMVLVRLYPEQNGETRIPRMPWARLYLCCSEHGLFDVTPH